MTSAISEGHMYMLSLGLIIIGLTLSPAYSRRLHHVKVCTLEQHELKCRHVTQEEADLITFPDTSCVVNSCGLNCKVTAWKDYFLSDKYELIRDAVIWTNIVPLNVTSSTVNIYECKNEGITCFCDEKDQLLCNGSPEYCAYAQCDNQTQCYCNVLPGIEQWNTLRDGELSRVHRIISIQECVLHRKSDFKLRRTLSVLRADEPNPEATDDLIFSENNITIRFVAPLFHFSAPGVLILRAMGYEQIHTANPPRLVIEVPHLFLETTNRLQFIFIDRQGKIVSGQFLVKGSTYCRKVRDIWSLDALYSIRCLPTAIQYIIITGTIIMTGLLLIYIKNIIKLIISTIRIIIFITRQTARLFRGTARVSLAGGHLAGNSVYALAQRGKAIIDRLEPPRLGNMHLTAAALTLLCMIGNANGSATTPACTSNEVIKSEISTCFLEGATRECEIKTTVQIYLNNLHTTCLYLEDPKEGHMITISVTLLEMKCDYLTTRNYFTFPVQLRTIIDVFCAQNDFCGWSAHCVRNKVTPMTGTPEALEYAGENSCKPAPFMRGCPLLHNNCFFYRNFLKPDYERAYEVRRITAQTCSYLVQVKEETANSSEVLTIKNIGVTKNGLRVHVFGSLQQTNLAFADICLISRVDNPAESYLAPCAPPSHPQKSEIGFVQANSSVAKQFLYDSGAITCEVFEEAIECDLLHSLIDNLHERQDLRLPKALAMHSFDITSEGNLFSSALTTAPVLLSLKFKDYKVSLKMAKVCPVFETTNFQFFGCYNCDFFSKLLVVVYSKCEEGQVTVLSNSLHIATPTVFLENTPKEAVILFKSNARCISDDLCLVSPYGTKCMHINFCLQPPEVILQARNSSTERIMFPTSVSSIWKSILGWPQLFSFGNIAQTLTYIGAGVLTCIFAFSAILTCIRR